MHVLNGQTSPAEQEQMSQLDLLFRNAHAIVKAGLSLTWSGCFTGLTRSVVSSSSALQKSSRPVYREVFSLEMVPIEANAFITTFTELLFSIYNL